MLTPIRFTKRLTKKIELANNILNVLKQKVKVSACSSIVSFTLLMSSEMLLFPTWEKLVDALLEIKRLNLLCIDEVYLFIDFELCHSEDNYCVFVMNY